MTAPDAPPVTVPIRPIGFLRTAARTVPRHWSASELEGTIEIDESFAEGLCDIEPGQQLDVLFLFHQSPPFDASLLRQTPPHRDQPRGVFSTCSPRRPNPIGLSVVEVLHVDGATLTVRGIDMFDGTPVLDLKPHVTSLQGAAPATA